MVYGGRTSITSTGSATNSLDVFKYDAINNNLIKVASTLVKGALPKCAAVCTININDKDYAVFMGLSGRGIRII